MIDPVQCLAETPRQFRLAPVIFLSVGLTSFRRGQIDASNGSARI